MPITQIPSNFLVTKQPKIFVLSQNSPVSGTYYTALDTTGRGKISKIIITNDTTTNNNLYIRVTIDGVVNSFSSPTNNPSVGLMHSTTAAAGAGQSIDYYSDINYLYSCKVEFMVNAAGVFWLYGAIMYSIE